MHQSETSAANGPCRKPLYQTRSSLNALCGMAFQIPLASRYAFVVSPRQPLAEESGRQVKSSPSVKVQSTPADAQRPLPAPTDTPAKPGGKSSSLSRSSVNSLRRLLPRILVVVLLAAGFTLLFFQLDLMTKQHSEGLDFEAFYTAGRILNRGEPNRLYDVSLQQEIQREVGIAGPFMAYYHPPFEAPLFSPFALFSYAHAFLLWAAVNLAVLGLIIFLLIATGYQLSSGLHFVWAAICLFFMLATLALGQDTLLLVPIFMLAYFALKRRREFIAGLVLGIGLFRLEVLLPFVFIFLLRRRWKLVAGFSVMGTIALVLSTAVVGTPGLAIYFKTLVSVGGAAGGSLADRTSAAMMPSLRGVMVALFGGVIPDRFMFPAVLLATVFLLGWTARYLRHLDNPTDRSFDLEFSLAVVAALLASYHVFVSELAPLILVGFLVLAYESRKPDHGVLANRQGTALFSLFLCVVVGAAMVHSLDFSVEAVVLLGLMVWLSREIAAPEDSFGSS